MLQRLSLVLLFSVAAVVAAALALGAYLNYGSVRAAYLGQIDSRLRAIGSGIIGDIETSISFGIPLSGQETLTDVLERQRVNDPVLAAIDVLGPTGTILHSSDPARQGKDIPLNATQGLRLVMPINNDFGAEVGSLRMVADPTILERNLETTATTVLHAAIAALVAAMVLALIAVALLLLGARRNARQAEDVAEGADAQGQGWALAETESQHREIAEYLDQLETKRP